MLFRNHAFPKARIPVKNKFGIISLVFVVTLALLLVFRLDVHSQQETFYWQHVQAIETSNFGMEHPDSISWATGTGLFYLNEGSRFVAFDKIHLRKAAFSLDHQGPDLAFIAFRGAGVQPLALDSAGKTITLLEIGTSRPAIQVDISPLGIQNVRGFTSDHLTGKLFILEAAGPTLFIVEPAADGSYDGSRVVAESRVERIQLTELMGLDLRGLAFHASSGKLFVYDANRDQLHTLSANGKILEMRDLSMLNILRLGNMVFAPSGDSTDDPANRSLYMLDNERGLVHELSFDAPPVPMGPDLRVPVTLVFSFTTNITNTGWTHNAPDPIGMDYHPGLGELIISDSEIEEAPAPYYVGFNVFRSTLSGNEVGNCDTTTFSNEPVGVSVNPDNGNIFFSRDNFPYGIHEVGFGTDGVYCTGDDTLNFYPTQCFGSQDPEGIAYANGKFYVADGVDREVYIVSPGPNLTFDSVFSPTFGTCTGDDTFTRFDTFSLGLNDPEGIDYGDDTGELFILNRNNNTLVRTTLTGTLITDWDISILNALSPGAVSLAPGSITPTKTMAYISQRGVDNGADPLENDGIVFEVDLGILMSPPNAIADLSISIAGTDSVLTWSPVTTNTNNVPLTVKSYHVYRDTDPDVDLTTPYTSIVQTIFTDTNAVSDTVQYYYAVIVEDTVGRSSAASNRVGLFPFTLFPGTVQLNPELPDREETVLPETRAVKTFTEKAIAWRPINS